MTAVGWLRSQKIAKALAAHAEDYQPIERREQLRLQLGLLNEMWRRAGTEVPYWSEQIASGTLPGRFDSLEEFRERAPLCDRNFLKLRLAEMTSRARPADWHRITGGTTSTPIQLPAWTSEQDCTRLDLWLGRSWYGITPASRLFLLWGHAHLLGTGLRGFLNARKREISDRLLGYYRFSAYDLREEALVEAGRRICRFRPDYVLGYSSALDLFAHANQANRSDLRSVGVKLVVATAESFPNEDSASKLEELFGCPVAMEYGAVETGLLAHMVPEGGYRVFWRNYLLEAEGEGPSRKLLVTSLYPRALPLIRYEIGDEIELDAGSAETLALSNLKRVSGRCNDAVPLPDGAIAHSELFTHALRPVSAIRSFQVVVEGTKVQVHYLSSEKLPEAEVMAIQGRLGRIHPSLADTPLLRVPSLRQSRAGKIPMIFRA